MLTSTWWPPPAGMAEKASKAFSIKLPRMVMMADAGRQYGSAERRLSGSSVMRTPSSAARQLLPISSAATDGSAMRSEMALVESARVRVSCSTYSSARPASPSCKSPRITCSLFINSWV